MQGLYRSHYDETLLINSDDAPGGVIVLYADGSREIIHVNHYVLDVFECASPEEFLDLTHGSFLHLLRDEGEAIAEGFWSATGQHEGFDHGYYRLRTKSGRLITIIMYQKPSGTTKNGRPVNYVFLTEVLPEAMVDWLTGLPSMTYFHDLARAGAKTILATGWRPATVAIDVMGMKSFNARYGRDVGDQLLRLLGELLSKRFGSQACSRFAEDHFYAFASENKVEGYVTALFGDLQMSGFEGVPPLRVGAYACDPDDDIVRVGFDRAKAACDLDRKTWQSHLTWFTDEMRIAYRLRNHVVESLDQAIAEGWIRPYYQAVVRSATGDVCNEEALARWIDPQYGPLVPDQFIPDLEDAGQLYKLDLHIVDCVVADMQRKREQGIPIVPVSINFSLRDLVQLNLTKELVRRIDAAGLPRNLLRIELTESVASSDPAFLRAQIYEMHQAGFEVWMDDFGSGYSSLNTLQEFDFDLIKLDMGFLRSAKVERSHVILAGVVQAAATLGVGTLTEGVETEEQAEFLAGIGCDMLQGYFYAKPSTLDDVIRMASVEGGMRRESFDEASYWNSVSLQSFTNLAERKEVNADWVPLSELPAGIVENRRGHWSIIRANGLYIDFLESTGAIKDLKDTYSDLCILPLPSNSFDSELYSAAKKSRRSGRWERIFGRLEYGTGYQFYVRHVSSSQDADAYMVSATPTMLGSGLGLYGDIPVAYAIFRVLYNDDATEVVDATYVYANNLYCDWGGFPQDSIVGKSFLEAIPGASRVWFSYCYRAAKLGEQVHDIVYSTETGHWLSFNISPCLVEDCCVYAFTLADTERLERAEMQMGLDTSELIIRMAGDLNAQTDYDDAMNGLLEEMSKVIHPERLYIFERGDLTSDNTFEWCAEGVEPQIQTLQGVDNSEFDTWERLLENNPVVIIPDVEELRDSDERMYWQLSRQGITHLLAVPFYSGNQLLGYLGADNYMLEEDLDSVRLLQSVASFVSARIVNQRLMKELERVGRYDDLTGLLNRRGVDLAIAAYLKAREGEPFALTLMDVDDFKTFNEEYSHAAGDAVMRFLAHRVQEVFPAEAIVGRNGGDEFLVLLPGKAARHMGDYLARFMGDDGILSFEFEGTSCPLAVSAGYVCYPEQADSLRSVYTKADAALYAVKISEKPGWRCYDPAMEVKVRSQTGFSPRDILENMPGGILVHRPGDDEVLLVNDELASLFECEDTKDFMAYTGGHFGGVAHPEDRELAQSHLFAQSRLESMRVGQKDYVEFRILTKWGHMRRIANTGRLVKVPGVGEVFYELVVAVGE